MDETADQFVAAIGREIRRRRLARGMTRAQISAEAGISNSNVTLYEKHGRGMSVHTLAKIADALGYTPARLIEAAVENADKADS